MHFISYSPVDINVQEVVTALHHFSRYHHIWRKDREETMRKYVEMYGFYINLLIWHRTSAIFVCVLNRFIEGSPLLSEFESQIIFYRDLELEVNSEPEYIAVGALALFTGLIKLQI